VPAQILSGAFAGCEALRTEQPANTPVVRDSQRCRGSEATSTTRTSNYTVDRLNTKNKKD